MKRSILLFTALLLTTSLIAQNIDKLNRLYQRKKFDKVITIGLKELKINPYHPIANMILGKAYAETEQYEKALPYLEKGAITEYNNRWVQAWSKLYLGICYYYLDDPQKSKRLINECVKLNATKNSKNEAINKLDFLQLSDFYDSWEIIETEHFRFHFQTPCTIEDKEQFIAFREAAYIKINEFFNATPIKKIEFFVWNDPKQAENILGSRLGFAKSSICLINSKTNQTTGHETTHILSDFGIKPTQKTKLINEGIAVYFNQSNRDPFAVAKESITGKEINITDLWENPKNYSEEYCYSIGGALIAYLFEKGTEKQVRDLMKDQTLQSARKIYTNLDTLMSDFTKKIKE